jgi:hypothetical protein
MPKKATQADVRPALLQPCPGLRGTPAVVEVHAGVQNMACFRTEAPVVAVPPDWSSAMTNEGPQTLVQTCITQALRYDFVF